jgi:uncharacterized protein (TIGR00251 family)
MATATREASPPAAVGPGRRGIRLRIRAVPGARREAILGFHGEALRVSVRAPADRGRANEALLDLLADRLGVGRRDLELLSGRSGRDKVLAVRGVDENTILRRIERLLEVDGETPGPGR